MKRTASALTLIMVLLCSAVVGVMPVNLAKANPVPDFIIIASPKGGTIYNSTEVPMEFTPIPPPVPENNITIWRTNFTSFSYSLDGHEFVPTDGNTTLTGLSSGSHTLDILGLGYKDGALVNNGTVCPTIHFDVFYHSPPPEAFPTALVITASGASAVTIGIGMLVYFRRRKKL